MAKQDMGDLVGDIAIGAARIVIRIAHHDSSTVRQVEGRGGECAGLKLVKVLKFGPVDEIVRGVDLDVEVCGKLADRHVRLGLEPELGTCAVGKSFGLGLESSSHGGVRRQRSAGGVLASLRCICSSNPASLRDASGLKVAAARR